MNHASRLSLLSVTLLVVGSCATTSGQPRPPEKASTSSASSSSNSSATDFTLRDTDGKQVSLSDYLGKQVVLIDFWATWCVPCEAELPHLQKLYADNRDRGFVVLAVAMDGPETVAQVGSYQRRYDLTFPVLLDEETRVVSVYNPKRTAPLSVLIDKKGAIFRVRSGYSAGDEKLIADDVSQLLGK